MLHRLKINHFALIRHLDLTLESGLTVITGETGAGKSIVLDALHVALGAKASGHLTDGAQEPQLEAHFDVRANLLAQDWLIPHGIDSCTHCVIQRTMSRGRFLSRINHESCSLKHVQDFASCLINSHRQNQQQRLTGPRYQLALLDRFSGHTSVLQDLQQAYEQWKIVDKKLEQALATGDHQEQKSYLEHQITELESLLPGEQALIALYQQHEQASSAAHILEQVQVCLDHLEGSFSVTQKLYEILKALGSLPPYSQQALSSTTDLLRSADIQIQEAHHELKDHLQKIEVNPHQLALLEERLSILHGLSLKHQTSIEQLPVVMSDLKQQLAMITNKRELQKQWEEQRSEYRTLYDHKSSELRNKRRQAAHQLSQRLLPVIRQLGMPHADLQIVVHPYTDDKPRYTGMEWVEFLFSANPGMAPAPLESVASGGELSRISLACEASIAQTHLTFIFDEVDSGISGTAATQVGQLLRALGEKAQVICITHLAQVAAFAHHHWHVHKKVDQQKTTSLHVTQLDRKQRIDELARLTAGLHVTTETQDHARCLLEQAQLSTL